MKRSKKADVACFGEVLWDILPAGQVPGGAPVNVAYHLHKHGIHAAVITRVGDDAAGLELSRLFESKGVDTSWFQRDSHFETGKVYAHPQPNHDVKYEILQPVAWDKIDWEEDHASLMDNVSCLVYGSLASRDSVSRTTLFRLLETKARKVFDVNLRAGFYTQELLVLLLRKADVVKMNREELLLINGWFNQLEDMEAQVRFVQSHFNIPMIVVTLGADGALMLVNNELIRVPGMQVKVEDTVGSGDAFLARLLAGMLGDMQPSDALSAANRLSAFMATRRGACPDYSPEHVIAFPKYLITQSRTL